MLSGTGLQHTHIGTQQKYGPKHLPNRAARDKCVRWSHIQGRGREPAIFADLSHYLYKS